MIPREQARAERWQGLRDHALRRGFEVLAEIPALAWLVDVGSVPRIVIGRGVDVREIDGRLEFTEGCWDGDFASSAVAEATHFFGSGFVVDAERVRFITASHTLAPVYVYDDGDRLLISNSLSFVVKYASVVLDPSVNIYSNARTIMKGILSYEKVLYQRGNDTILQFVHCSFMWSAGEIRTEDKGWPPPIADFAAYRDYVRDVLRRVRDNAASPHRARRYTLLSTVSSGYDSVAVTALAAGIGCEAAVTLRTGKERMVDSGKPVADALGLRCVERERGASNGRDPYDEADFIVSFDAGDSAYTAFSGLLSGALLLVGDHGDVLWDPQVPASDCIVRNDTCGMGLHEFRLRTDFVVVPVVFIGALRHADIRRISLSDELAPYSVGGVYDRPVPRRIAEEAGVPRALFGQQKKAVNMNLFGGERLMSEQSRAGIAEFAAQRVSYAFLLREHAFRVMQHVLDLGSGSLDGSLSRTLGRVLFIRRPSRRLGRYFHQRWGASRRPYFNYVLLWALERTGERYAAATRPEQRPQPFRQAETVRAASAPQG